MGMPVANSPTSSIRAADIPTGMRLVPGATFVMGSDCHYPEEAPSRRAQVASFLIDETPVTNAQFAQFVAETGYVTLAEIAPDPSLYPGIRTEMIRAGSLLFVQPSRPVPLNQGAPWWTFSFGTSWKNPQVGVTADDLPDHPVTHVAYADAAAYAAWSGKELPTEAQWERAARGGLDGAEFAWGDDLMPGGRTMANTWQGEFPCRKDVAQGYAMTSPVTFYPPNPFGVYDLIGNVWEWTQDWFADPRVLKHPSCCVAHDPRGGGEAQSCDPRQPEIRIGRKVLKGGSHLCAPNYCRRYRPAARYPQPVDTSTSHVGFRCVQRLECD